MPVHTNPLGPFRADTGFSEGADVTIPGESATPAGWTPSGPVVDDRPVFDRALDVAEARRERDAVRLIEAAAHLVLDAAQVPSGFTIDRRVAKLADRARLARDECDALAEVLLATGKERDEAVAAISSARADSAELAALRAFLRDGGTTDGLSQTTFRALADCDDRRNIRSRDPERRPAYDVPRMLNVAEYAVGQLLDLIADEAGRECAPSPEVLRALRALTLGRVPEPSTESPIRTDKAER